MQLIICYESRKGKSDKIYINEFLKYFYPDKLRGNKLDWVHLDSKAKCQQHDHEINDKKAKYAYTHKNAKSVVIFCLDSDYGRPASSSNNEIIQFCSNHGYEIIWFHRDIEEALIKKHFTTSKQKTVAATNFAKNKAISKLDLSKLKDVDITSKTFGTSNVKSVFDKYLK